MTDHEDALSAGLHDLAGRATPGSPPISTLLSRGRRHRRTRATFAGAAAVAGIGVVAALAATGSGYGAAHSAAVGVPSGSQAGPISLGLAAARTDASPFHFTLTAKSTAPKAEGGQTKTASSEGDFDPSTNSGYTKSTGGRDTGESIAIGGKCYAQPVAGSSWLIVPCTDDSLSDLTADPAADLKQLEADGQATYVGRSGSGSGQVDTWKFTITRKTQTLPGNRGTQLGYTATGTATVGVADGHVHAIDFTIKALPNRIVVGVVSDVSITFSDYGVPVHVIAPASASAVGGAR